MNEKKTLKPGDMDQDETTSKTAKPGSDRSGKAPPMPPIGKVDRTADTHKAGDQGIGDSRSSRNRNDDDAKKL